MIIDVEDFLEHNGVKGQKWGVRQQHNLNKASRHSVRVKTNNQIDGARNRSKRKVRRIELKNAKANYKIDKVTLGRREAKLALNKVKDRQTKDKELASTIKYGKETAAVLLAAGTVTAARIAINARS